jgi:hypothetical protein
VGDAAEVDLEGHAGLFVAGDGALAGERLGDGARVRGDLLAGLEVGRLGPAVQAQVVHGLALVLDVEGEGRPGGDLDDLGVDLHLLEHDGDSLR